VSAHEEAAGSQGGIAGTDPPQAIDRVSEYLPRPRRRMREVFALASPHGQRFPGPCARGFLVQPRPALEQVLERETRGRPRRQRTERHVPQKIRTETVGDPERRIGASGRIELDERGGQRFCKTDQKIAIAANQRDVPLV
jgi:hypothetical protein